MYFLFSIGVNVKPLTKGKVSAYAGPVEKVFSPAHCTFSVTHPDDLTEDVINDKVTFHGSFVWALVILWYSNDVFYDVEMIEFIIIGKGVY